MHDPGWRRVAIVVIPLVGTSRLRQIQLSPIEQIRALFLSFASAAVVFAFAASIAANDLEPSDGALVAIVALGTVCVGLAIALVRRPVDRSSVAALWDSYRKRFFTAVASAEAPMLVGFLLAIADGSAWLGIIGSAFALVGLVIVAPTRGRVAQERLLESIPPPENGRP